MGMPNELRNFLNAVGAMGELAGALRDSLMRAGFTREESVLIVKDVLVKMMSPNPPKKDGRDEHTII